MKSRLLGMGCLVISLFSTSFAATSTDPIAREDAVLAEDSSFNTAYTPKSFETFMQGIQFQNPTGYWPMVNSPVPTPSPEAQMGPQYIPRTGYESLSAQQERQLARKVTGW